MGSSNTPRDSSHGGVAAGRNWRDLLSGPGAAAAVLALFWIFMVASLRDKSLTYDEVAYAASGYSYWHSSDYRLQPENGQLPQRLAGLPMALSIAPFPEPDPSAWRNAEQWQLGYQWLYRSGRDASILGVEGRICCGLFAVALGALVWAWSRQLFGRRGAMVSLLLFVMSPTVLANGALMTSDAAAALFFAASAWGIWAVLDRMTIGRVLISTLLVAGLFLSKISALLICPMAFLMVACRLVDGRPLTVSIWDFRREVSGRLAQTMAMAASAVVHMLVVVALIWAGYGFRFSAFSDSGTTAGRFRIPWEYLLAKPDPASILNALELTDSEKRGAVAAMASNGAVPAIWTNSSLDAMHTIRLDVLTPPQRRQYDAMLAVPSPVLWVRMVEAAREKRLLPEAWKYGITDVYRRSQVRPAFLNGEFHLRGWPSFFPYTFLIKTPLAMFGIIALAIVAVARPRQWQVTLGPRVFWTRLYGTLPLWILLVIYWGAAIASSLNIGHRHLLPIYAPMFILCGAVVRCIDQESAARREGARPPMRGFARAGGMVLGVLIVLLGVEAVRTFPNYLAYFNGIVAPRNAYRHLVDSSLDWGQDLPSVRAYINRHPSSMGAFYLSYFGTASPEYYGINARELFSVAGLDWQRRPDWKNVFMAPESVGSAVTALLQEWPEHNLIGLNKVGSSVVATLLRKPEDLRLGAGTYFISASMLQPVNFELAGPWGRWNARYEKTYQELSTAVRPLMNNDIETRRSALAQRSSADWELMLRRFEEYRFGRLTAFMRHREPDEEINFTILVYHLSDADIVEALDGPPAELGADDGALEKSKLPGLD